jgi:hypothetical protein
VCSSDLSYAIGEAQPAAIVNALGGVVIAANILDTSLGKKDSLSRDCIATHIGVKIDNSCLIHGADVPLVRIATAMCMSRLAIRVFYAERPNEEMVGRLEDFPEGKGMNWGPSPNDAAGGFAGVNNGFPSFENVRPLPQPLPFAGGVTYFRVTFEPSRRGNGPGNGIACGTITSLRTDVYGVSPPRAVPVEATQTAFAALASLR